MDCTFATMQREDLEFVNKVRNECREFLHDDRTFTLAETNDWYNKTNPRWLTIFKMDLVIRVGYIRLAFDEKEYPHTTTIYVGMDIAKEKRRLGIAKQVFPMLLAMCKAKGFKTAKLEVLSNNIPAFELYKKLGFHSVDIKLHQQPVKKEPLLSIVMELPL